MNKLKRIVLALFLIPYLSNVFSADTMVQTQTAQASQSEVQVNKTKLGKFKEWIKVHKTLVITVIAATLSIVGIGTYLSTISSGSAHKKVKNKNSLESCLEKDDKEIKTSKEDNEKTKERKAEMEGLRDKLPELISIKKMLKDRINEFETMKKEYDSDRAELSQLKDNLAINILAGQQNIDIPKSREIKRESRKKIEDRCKELEAHIQELRYKALDLAPKQDKENKDLFDSLFGPIFHIKDYIYRIDEDINDIEKGDIDFIDNLNSRLDINYNKIISDFDVN